MLNTKITPVKRNFQTSINCLQEFIPDVKLRAHTMNIKNP